MSSRRTYTLEFKQQAVRLMTEQGLTSAEVGRRLGIDGSLLRYWKQALEPQTPASGSRVPSALETENARLRAENERLRMEREILKKATAFFAKESP
jgi:transposase